MSKKKRRDSNKSAVKNKLFEIFGKRCWLCCVKFNVEKLTLHHIIPFKEVLCTTFENSMILCKNCHFNIVNKIPYPSEEYDRIMEIAKENAKRFAVNKPNDKEERPE